MSARPMLRCWLSRSGSSLLVDAPLHVGTRSSETADRTATQFAYYCEVLHRCLATPDGPLNVPPVPTASAGRELPLLSVVVPTFNEAANIEPFLHALSESLHNVRGCCYELIVVDDDSPDRTWERAQSLLASYPELRVMRRTREHGLSSAVVRGWQAAQGDYLATINSDFQHPPGLIPEMLKRMPDADLVVASRYLHGRCAGEFPIHRRLLTRCAWQAGYLMVPEVFRKVTDPLSGFYVVKRQAIQGIELRPAGFKTLIEVLGRGRVSEVVEISYDIRKRQVGRSKVRVRHGLDYVVQLARLRRALAHH